MLAWRNRSWWLRTIAIAGNVASLMQTSSSQLCVVTSAYMAAGMTSRARRPEPMLQAG